MQIVKPNTNLPFISNSRAFLIISGVVVLACFLLPFLMRPNWGTSFDGGSSVVVRFEKDVSSEQVRSAFVAMNFKDASVQTYGGDNRFLIKTKALGTISCEDGGFDKAIAGLPAALGAQGVQGVEKVMTPPCKDVRDVFPLAIAGDPARNPAPPASDKSPRDVRSGVTAAQLTAALSDAGIDAAVTYQERGEQSTFFVRPRQLESVISKGLAEIMNKGITDPAQFVFNPEIGVAEIVTVGPDVGEKFKNDGILSIIFALGLILLYIAIRFDIRYAPGAVAALGHDVIITFGLLTLMRMEITLETVAALLAIVGYSLNDTIVTFDRIRENLASSGGQPVAEVVNRSINECLSRTLLTSITTLVAIASLAIVGTGVVADFAVTLIIGVLVGTYSSIFVASPIMIIANDVLERRKAKRRALPPPPEEADATVSG
jgi:preprotein translocase subunit SecF